MSRKQKIAATIQRMIDTHDNSKRVSEVIAAMFISVFVASLIVGIVIGAVIITLLNL